MTGQVEGSDSGGGSDGNLSVLEGIVPSISINWFGNQIDWGGCWGKRWRPIDFIQLEVWFGKPSPATRTRSPCTMKLSMRSRRSFRSSGSKVNSSLSRQTVLPHQVERLWRELQYLGAQGAHHILLSGVQGWRKGWWPRIHWECHTSLLQRLAHLPHQGQKAPFSIESEVSRLRPWWAKLASWDSKSREESWNSQHSQARPTKYRWARDKFDRGECSRSSISGLCGHTDKQGGGAAFWWAKTKAYGAGDAEDRTYKRNRLQCSEKEVSL